MAIRANQFVLLTALGLNLGLIASCGQSPNRPVMSIPGGSNQEPDTPGDPGSKPDPKPSTDKPGPGGDDSIPDTTVPLPIPLPPGAKPLTELDFSVPGKATQKRLWRLTTAQYTEAVDSLLGRRTKIETLFDADPVAAGGFGNESGSLLASGSYASKLEQAVFKVVKSSLPQLEKELSCGKYTSIDDKCLTAFVESFAAKAFRRPPSKEEISRYKKVYTTLVDKKQSKEIALTAAAEAILRSPFTVFRFELGESGKSGEQKLPPYELAQALSFALTNSPPDATLLAKAKDGSLADKKVYFNEALRLLQSEGFIKAFTDYSLRWSESEWIDGVKKDEKLFPDFDDAVKDAMYQEIKAFARENVKKGTSFEHFLTSESTTIIPPLASIYDVPEFKGTKTIQKSDGQRSGILTLPGVVAVHSTENGTAPMARAVFLMNKLSCSPPPPPPDVLESVIKPDPNAPLRDQFKAHAQGSCAACHVIMDPFGFSLGNYDPIGRYQTEEKNKPIDASGVLAGTTVPFKNAVELFAQSTKNPDMQECFVRQAFRYINGRMDNESDKPLIQNALKNFKDTKLSMASVFLTFVNSESFKTRNDGSKK